MVVLTDGQRANWEDALHVLSETTANFQLTALNYRLPNGYPELLSLAGRQMTAIRNLLDTGETGCGIDDITFNQEVMLSRPHLENLAYIGALQEGINGEERQAFFDHTQIVVQGLKGKAQPIQTIGFLLGKLISPPSLTDKTLRKSDGWKR